MPAQTPEPIRLWPKRLPSSSVQLTSSTGASVVMSRSLRLRMTSRPAMTPSAPSNLPPEGWLSRWLPKRTGRRAGSRPGRRANMLPMPSMRMARPWASQRARKWSRPCLSTGPSARRRTPPFGVAPMVAMSIRLSHRRRPSMRWLVRASLIGGLRRLAATAWRGARSVANYALLQSSQDRSRCHGPRLSPAGRRVARAPSAR